jgi:hypothetical protein
VKRLLLAAAFCASTGCVSNDFKVVDALRPGMNQAEALETIAAYGFKRETAKTKPSGGWPRVDGTMNNLTGHALAVEKKVLKDIETAEVYPVHHGLLGYGLVYLFYDANGKLVEFYRRQIN